MGCLIKISVVTVLLSVLIGYFVYNLGQLPDLPDIQVIYWGPGKEKPDDKSIKPFKVDYGEKEWQSLHRKLSSARALVPPLEGVGFDYGMNTEYLNSFVEYWRTSYNWTERQAYINSIPHYKTQIGGLDIHFIHSKPDAAKTKGKKVVPLLLIHGWPGSVLEFYKMIPLLTSPRPKEDFVFEVIAPSLPGYGFSQGASKPGMGVAYMGAIFHQLMHRLGFDKFYVQGGDWGSAVGASMSVLYPQSVLAYHTNFCMPGTSSSNYRMLLAYLFPSFFMDESQIERYQNQFVDTYLLEMGYMHIQATKPDTVGIALTDSPVGLAAYILEKFSTWTNRAFRKLPDGGLGVYNRDELIDNIMIYWLTKSITTSMRLYSEQFNKKYYSMGLQRHPIRVPTGCVQFPQELMYYPQIALEGTFHKLISNTEMPKGGHFGAFEQPQLLAEDVWKFISTVSSMPKKK